jgi:uncharacterized protein YcfL
MRHIWKVAVVALLLVACGSAGGSALFRREVGTASGPDALERGALVLKQFHYEVVREEQTPNLMLETNWLARSVFADEQELGISDAESRVIINGRQRVDTLLGSVYAMSIVVENRVRHAGSDAWVETVNTPMFAGYAESIAKRLEEELRTIGVRRF